MKGICSLVLAGFAVTLAGCTASTEPTPVDVKMQAAGQVQPDAIVLRNPCSTIQPTYLLRLPDNDGAAYWPGYWVKRPDGYTIPFPTPWITTSFYPDVHAYEWLQWEVPSSQDYEYLVKVVYTSSCVDPLTGGQAACFRGFADGERQYFTVPFTSWSDLAQAKANAAQYQYESNVHSQIIECVHIVESQTANPSVGQVLVPIENDIFVDVHDPRNPPYNP
jgi:hypothetical protein